MLEILALRERAGEPFERSVLQMLQDVNHRALLADLLGVRRGAEGLMVAINHPGLANKMAKTKWGRANLRNLLMQLDGAVVTASPRSFGGLKKRAVVIPYETLTAIGVEFSDDNGTAGSKWSLAMKKQEKGACKIGWCDECKRQCCKNHGTCVLAHKPRLL